MVLSNKKIKQRLRALRGEIVVASEAEKNPGNSQDALSKAPPALRAVLGPVSLKPRLSKRVIRRERAAKGDAVENGEVGGDAEIKEQSGPESDAEEVKENTKRKRDESEALEESEEKKPKVKERKMRWRDRDRSEVVRKEMEREARKRKTMEMERKKMEREARQLNRKKNKKQAENGEVKEGVQQSESGATAEQLVAVTNESTERKDVEVSDKIYVGGIPYYSTEDDIRSFFESCGTITEIDCMTFPDTGKFRGIAIITFKTEAAAKRGLALDGSDMGGLFLKIQPFKSSSKVSKLPDFSPSLVEGYNRIYIGNLSWDVAEDNLRNLFADCTIESIRFGEDKESGEFKGYAHVDFGDGVSLNKALKLDQTVVCGRPVKITYAVPKKGTVVTSLKTPLKDNQVSAVDETLVTAKTEVHAVSSEVNISNEENANVSAKIRRRTCYECGERGHISSLCPKKKADDSTNPDKETEEFKEYSHGYFGDTVSMNTSLKSEQMRITYPVTNLKMGPKYDQLNAVVDTQVNTSSETYDNNTVISSKIRRRTCYECGERGHISSLCPKQKADGSTNPVKEMVEFKGYGHADYGPGPNKGNVVTDWKTGPTYAVVDTQVNTSNDTNANAVASSKIKRRTCYECGERGHISSLCPKQKADDSTNPVKETVEFKGYGHADYGPGPNKGNVVTDWKTGPTYDQLNAVVDTQVNTSNETNANAVVSSKIKRRTCYECGKRGHISSLCPEKKEDNLANQGGA